MKVLFIYTNIDGFHYDNYHFGLATLVSVTKNLGHDTEVFILTKREDYAIFATKINDFKPDIVGFSSVSSQYMFVKDLAKMAKNILPNIITIAGGVHPTLSPDSLLETNFIDGFLMGESELALEEFLYKIDNGLPYKDTDNFAYVKDGKVIRNKLKKLVEDLDTLPIPDKDIYPYYRHSIKHTRQAPFFFTRGCPYTCTYCMNQSFADLYNRKRNYPRHRSVEPCIQEIEQVVEKYHKEIDYVFIGDDIFGPNFEWRKEFCDQYKERIWNKYNMKFMVLLRVEMCKNEKLLKVLKDAGAFRIFFGVESGDEAQRREVLDRQMTDETIYKAFANCHKNGLETLAVNIIGFPDETEEMIKRTVSLNRSLGMTHSGVNVFYPYRGTPLGDFCFENDLVDLDKFNSFSNERRESVLRFSKERNKMIMKYYNNWDSYVHPFWSQRGFQVRYKKVLRNLGIIDEVKAVYKYILKSNLINYKLPNKIGFRPGRSA